MRERREKCEEIVEKAEKVEDCIGYYLVFAVGHQSGDVDRGVCDQSGAEKRAVKVENF